MTALFYVILHCIFRKFLPKNLQIFSKIRTKMFPNSPYDYFPRDYDDSYELCQNFQSFLANFSQFLQNLEICSKSARTFFLKFCNFVWEKCLESNFRNFLRIYFRGICFTFLQNSSKNFSQVFTKFS